MPHVERAVDALSQSWNEMAGKYRTFFHPGIREPDLTRVVRAHVRKRAPAFGLPGRWGAEDVENDVDLETGEILDEGRTDIAYHWNDETKGYEVVFEFKKLNDKSRSRTAYIGSMLKFITGIYSQKQPLAMMVGILMAPRSAVEKGLKRALSMPAKAAVTRACQDKDGRFVHEPSILLPKYAAFDTEHVRDPAKAPDHGTIRLGHALVEFPYVTYPDKKKRRVAIEDET